MPRPRAFDETAVLTGAMMAFRRRGFAGSSVQDLERATGVSAGSLYNAYGDKDGLYRAAFEHYFATVIEPRWGAAVTLEDLERVLLGLFDMPMADGLGCLVTNTAIEFGQAPSLASDFVARGLDRLESAMRAVLRREIGAPAARVATRRLVLISQGILVLSRVGRLTGDDKAVVRAEFEHLRALRRRNPRSR
jgi:TetR/AcrR family transcriptional repressor of nem operon